MVQQDAGLNPLCLTDSGGDYFRWVNQSQLNEASWKSFDSYALVRNPWDRVVSWWAYLEKERMEFRDFVMGEPWNKGTNQIWVHGLPCSYWTHQNGKQLIRNILRFEYFHQSAKTILAAAGIPDAKVSVQNQTDRGPYLDYYDDETRDKVAEMYKDDIALFGYEFGKDKSATSRSF